MQLLRHWYDNLKGKSLSATYQNVEKGSSIRYSNEYDNAEDLQERVTTSFSHPDLPGAIRPARTLAASPKSSSSRLQFGNYPSLAHTAS